MLGVGAPYLRAMRRHIISTCQTPARHVRVLYTTQCPPRSGTEWRRKLPLSLSEGYIYTDCFLISLRATHTVISPFSLRMGMLKTGITVVAMSSFPCIREGG